MKAGILAAGALAAALFAGGASAATLTATWNTDTTGTTFAALNSGVAFTVDFTDIENAALGTMPNVLDVFDDDQDGLYEVNEITAFSGISFESGAGIIERNFIRFVPTIAGFTNGTQAAGGNVWQIQAGFTTSLFSVNEFTYSLSGVNSGGGNGNVGAVPVPAALPLLLTGIAAFGFLRRRKAA